MDKREIGDVFRERLAEVVRGSGGTRGAFAARIGVDRSTLAQLLRGQGARLPRAETIAAIAREARVSVDWLLGLSQQGHVGADVVREAVAIEHRAGSPADARLQRWHAEAAGYKIRYVPTTLPDLLKTEEVIRFEFDGHATVRPERHIEQAEARLEYSRRPETDIEVCSPLQTLEALARGEGVWRTLPPRARRAQLDAIIELLDELYPTLRWFLYDGRQRYSVPLTIFGPQRAAVYVGDMYLVFNATEHIRVLTRHFDGLIRDAAMQPRGVVEYARRLAAAV